MKKYKYVVVGGDSFSATDAGNLVNPGETYGDVVANHFGAKFYNLAISGGSLQRMNRKILEWCSKDIDKFEDTLIILGITTVDRFEIWSNYQKAWYRIHGGWEEGWHDDLIAAGAGRNIIKSMKNYFINFYNYNAQITIANNILIGLQSFLTLNNIDHIFFDALAPPNKGWNNLVSQENWYKNSEYKSMIDFIEKNRDMRLSEEDFHPNKKAHKYWAGCLLEYINE